MNDEQRCVCGHARYWHRFPVGDHKAECYASVRPGFDCACPEFEPAKPWADGTKHAFNEDPEGDDLCTVCRGTADDPIHSPPEPR